MYRHDDCMCKSKEFGREYARAYILPQKYENLYSCKEGFIKGTIFKDLYKPYHKHHEYHEDYEHHEHEHDYEYEYKKIEYER
jgi:hypothetical protein